MIKIYSDLRWTLLRLTAHIVGLLCIYFLVYIVTPESSGVRLIVLGTIVSALLLCYPALIYVQAKFPLLKIDESEIEYINLFDIGKKKLPVESIGKVECSQYRIKIYSERGRIRVNLYGIKKEKITTFRNELASFFKRKNIKLINK